MYIGFLIKIMNFLDQKTFLNFFYLIKLNNLFFIETLSLILNF